MFDVARPPDPYDLIGDHWCEISAAELAALGSEYVAKSHVASTAEQRLYDGVNQYEQLCPEGFEVPISAARRGGYLFGEFSAWVAGWANDVAIAAEALARDKALTASVVESATAQIVEAEAEIVALHGLGMAAESQIAALRQKIKAIKDAARDAVELIYDAIEPPPSPPALGLQPVKYTGPPTSGGSAFPTQPVSNGPGETGPASNGQAGRREPGEISESPSTGGDGDSAFKESGYSVGQDTRTEPGAVGEQAPVSQPASPGGGSSSQAAGSSASSAQSGVSGASSGASSMSSFGSSGSMGSAGSSGASSGASSMSGLGGSGSSASSMGSGASSGASSSGGPGLASGLSSAAPAGGASSASTGAAPAGSQSFRPPPGATTPAAPAASAPQGGTQPAGQRVTATPTAPPGAMSSGGGGMPLASAPPAGVPAPAAAPATPATPPAVGGASPPGAAPSAPPPTALNLGEKSAAVQAARMGSHAFGEGVGATPEYSAALSLVAALNEVGKPDVFSPILPGWSCAVFGEGAAAEFVVAEQHGFSWIPAGVRLPAQTVVAHLDERVPQHERLSWRGLEPSALVLSLYARAIGEQPRIVVAPSWDGLEGRFPRGVALAADEQPRTIVPNPVLEPTGRHRLELADQYWWEWVHQWSDEQVPGLVRMIAEHLTGCHNELFSGDNWPVAGADRELRATVLDQIGRSGGETELAQQLRMKMVEMGTRLFGPAPDIGSPHWRARVDLEMQIRGWETLLLALSQPANRSTVADMMYSMLLGTNDTLPVGAPTTATASA